MKTFRWQRGGNRYHLTGTKEAFPMLFLVAVQNVQSFSEAFYIYVVATTRKF